MLDLIDMSQLIVLMFSYNKIKTVEVEVSTTQKIC